MTMRALTMARIVSSNTLGTCEEGVTSEPPCVVLRVNARMFGGSRDEERLALDWWHDGSGHEGDGGD